MKKALITGATGFIGGRLAEATCALGIPTVAVVRQWSRAARLSRLPVELAAADILDPESLRRAMAGCDVVFHCAVDFRRTGRAHRRSSVAGTRHVLQAAQETGVQRVVYLSTTAVFGRTPPPGVLTEDAVTPRTGAIYGDAKLDAERIALDYHRRGLAVAILRPTIVYGPFCRTWIEEFAAAIRDGRMVLVNGGTGTCNALYVDNLVDAMLLAARHPAAPGEVFHISDTRTVTWREFLEALARALGDDYLPLPEMTMEEIDAARARAARGQTSSLAQTLRLLADPRFRAALRSVPVIGRLEAFTRTTARAVLPDAVLRRARETVGNWRRAPSGGGTAARVRPLLRPSLISLLASTTTFSVEKARRILGYDPGIDFQAGMRLTAAWIRWAGL